MKCLKCGTEQPEGGKFCKECGSKVELTCPQCKKRIPADSKFCLECGSDLRKPKEARPLDLNQPRSYTPKHLADKILTTRGSMDGERKKVTVMFADVANSTAMFEKLDPEDVHNIMDGCLRLVLDEVHRYEGTVNQFLGDGVMAIFGAPIAHEDHAQRACHAALAVQKALEPYAESLKNRYGIDFKMRIGLNCGPVVVGAVGDDLRMDYTAKGDIVNLAARMETSAEPGAIIISKNLYRQAKEFFEFEPIGEIRVKGKDAPVEAYRLLNASDVETRIAASTAKGLTRFIGRMYEIEALKGAFEKVKSGEGQVVGIVGEAGVGKSRLLLEFRNSLPQDEYLYFEGRCLHYGGSMPYLPVLGIVRSFIGIKEGEQEYIIRHKLREGILGLDEDLSHVIPPFQELLSLKVDDEAYAKLDPKQKREKTFEAFRDLLVRGSQDRPLVLAIEDLHWIDRTTEEFLDYMIGWLPRTGILLLLLYRPEYIHQWGNRSYYSRIAVGELSTIKSAELVAAILEGGDAAPELQDLILRRAAGNPFFMEELTHSLLENGSIEKKGEKFVLAEGGAGVQIPDTIQGIIAARMDRLEESLKKIMQVAAVIGREFAFRILEAISEVKEDVKSGLLNLQGLEFIYEKSLFPELEYVFKHALTQEVAYNSLLMQRRKEIHERIGRAIEELYPHRLEEFYEMLAYHYARGEDIEKAGRYLRLSGNKAVARHSLWEAYSFYKEALTAVRRLPKTKERKKQELDVLVLAPTPLHLLGYPEGCIGMLQEGEILAKELQDGRRLAFFYGRLSAYHTYRGNHLQAVQYSEDAFQESLKSEDVDLVCPIAYGLCLSYLGTGQSDKIVAQVPAVLDLIEKKQRTVDSFALHVNPYALLTAYCGLCLGWMGNFQEGEQFLEKALAHATSIGDLRNLAVIENCYGWFYHVKGDWKAVVEHHQKNVGYSEEVKFSLVLNWGWSALGNAYAYLGDPETGRTYGEKGIAMAKDAGIEWFLSYQNFCMGGIHLQLGDLENAQHFMEEALRLSQKANEKYWEAQAWIFLGHIMDPTVISQLPKAEKCILQGMKIADKLKAKPTNAQGHLFLGEIYTRSGQRDKSIENLRKAESMFHEMGMDYWLGKAQDALAKL